MPTDFYCGSKKKKKKILIFRSLLHINLKVNCGYFNHVPQISPFTLLFATYKCSHIHNTAGAGLQQPVRGSAETVCFGAIQQHSSKIWEPLWYASWCMVPKIADFPSALEISLCPCSALITVQEGTRGAERLVASIFEFRRPETES